MVTGWLVAGWLVAGWWLVDWWLVAGWLVGGWWLVQVVNALWLTARTAAINVRCKGQRYIQFDEIESLCRDHSTDSYDKCKVQRSEV